MKNVPMMVCAVALTLCVPATVVFAGLFPRTWESAVCTSRAVAELEVELVPPGDGAELVVGEFRLVEALYDPHDVLKHHVDFREEWKRGLEAQLRLYQRLARGRPRYAAQFSNALNGRLRLVVFVTFVDSKAKVKLRWGDASLSGVNVSAHKSHRAWKRVVKKMLARRTRAEGRGAAPGFCSKSRPEDSDMRRFSKPLESFPKSRR